MHLFFSRFKLPFLAVATVVVCVVLHETGHALAGLATGGHISHVEIFSVRPHVRITGVAGIAGNSFRALAGSGAVLLTWAAVILLAGKRRGIVVQSLTFFSFIEVLGWFLSALVHRFSPQANDAGKFLMLAATAPESVAGACLLVFALGWWLYSGTGPQRRSDRLAAA